MRRYKSNDVLSPNKPVVLLSNTLFKNYQYAQKKKK